MIIASLLFGMSTLDHTQRITPPSETHQFDFWVGEWDAIGTSYGPGGKQTRTEAKNSITRDLAGHVVRESFKMPGLSGMSISVFDPGARLWRQTWVDNQGEYIALAGTFTGGKMILHTIPRPLRPNSVNRMVFSKITSDSFDWDWDASADAGATWLTSGTCITRE